MFFPMDVSFPKLGIEFSINNVAFTLFGKEFYWYAIIIATGFLLAFVYAIFFSKNFGIEIDPMIDVVLVCTILGIIGARIYYVIFSWENYKDNFWSAFEIWNGGLAIYGAVIGAFLGGWYMTKRKNMDTLAMFDLASIGFLIGQGVGRWGNFINQEAFGSETDLPWGMVSFNTGNVAVHPCFLYESIWCLAGVALLHFLSVKFYKFRGQIFFSYLIWYGLGRAWIEALRSDSLWLIPDVIKVSQLISVVIVIAAGVLMWCGFTNRIKFNPVSANNAPIESATDEAYFEGGFEEQAAAQPAEDMSFEFEGTFGESAAAENDTDNAEYGSGQDDGFSDFGGTEF